MRWRTTRSGDTRTRTFFAFFPYEHNHQVYWLEFVTIREVYRTTTYDNFWHVVEVIEAN